MGIVGAEAAHLERHGMSKTPLIMAFIFTMMAFYFMQLACQLIWTIMAFRSTFPLLANDMYFWYVMVFEFLLLIFVRTRSSIKFCARYITIANIIFLLYINSYMYACTMQLLNVLWALSLTIFFFFLHFFEVPAMNEWNPFAQNTPRWQSPRIGY
jgi:hypothetical protein